MSTKQNKPTTKDRCNKAIQGVTKHMANVPSATLDGVPWTPASITATLQAAIDGANATDSAKGAWQAAVKAGEASKVKAVTLLVLLKQWAELTFGKGNAAVMADFGFTGPKPKKPKVATKAVAQTKSQATRTARHTMGSQQKKKVTGAAPTPTAPKA